MFGEGFLVEFESFLLLVELGVCVGDSGVGLGDELEIGSVLATHFDGFLALGNALGVFLLLEIHRRHIRQDAHVGLVLGEGFAVQLGGKDGAERIR